MLKITQVYYEHQSAIAISHNYALLFLDHGDGSFSTGDAEPLPVVSHRVYLIKDDQQISLIEGSFAGCLFEFPKVVLDHFIVDSLTHPRIGIFNQDSPLPFVDMHNSAIPFLKSLLSQLISELEMASPLATVEQYCFMLFRHINRNDLLLSRNHENKEKAQRIAQLIDQFYVQERSSTFYADQLGISTRDLNKLARKLYGKRFGEVLLARVCFQADLMLADVNKPIKVIAWALGYEEYGHFNTMYLRCKGYSAAEFRNKIINKNIE